VIEAFQNRFPKDHRAKIHSINPLERLGGEIKRCTDVVGIFPNEDAITRLVGILLLEQNDEGLGNDCRAVMSSNVYFGYPSAAADLPQRSCAR
jgi:transposase-like protein